MHIQGKGCHIGGLEIRSINPQGRLNIWIPFAPRSSPVSWARKLAKFRHKLMDDDHDWNYEVTCTFDTPHLELYTVDKFMTLNNVLRKFLDTVRHKVKRDGLEWDYVRIYEEGTEKGRPHYHLLLTNIPRHDVPLACEYSVNKDKFENKLTLNRWADTVMKTTWMWEVWGQGRLTIRQIPHSGQCDPETALTKYFSEYSSVKVRDAFAEKNLPPNSRLFSSSRSVAPYASPLKGTLEKVGGFCSTCNGFDPIGQGNGICRWARECKKSGMSYADYLKRQALAGIQKPRSRYKLTPRAKLTDETYKKIKIAGHKLYKA